MIKGLIFDLDGVIVSTEHHHYLAWKAIANKLGVFFTSKENELLKGISRRESLLKILELGNLALDEDKISNLLLEKNEIYLNSISSLDNNSILLGVENLLQTAKEKKILLAIGSSSKNAKFILDKLKLSNYFDAIVDGSMVRKLKPDPQVFLMAAKMMQLSPKECVVFEDALSGVEAAKKGGFIVYGVGNSNLSFYVDNYIENLNNFDIELL